MIDGFRAEVRKLKEEIGPITVTTTEARASEVALAHFRVRFPKLEVEEDPYATLPEDDDVPMEVEVPFDERDPPST
ncbi:hypothetical protein B296_00030128 [Ensete ventricosum]|uniref:Uncharacterized protein n=1 Tax=Ensete ventricosum TaxID=4639 RepID=A0A427AFS9_ENSVE|nr:hypothetical protein B296_00030128 [Ensete ventricosum]